MAQSNIIAEKLNSLLKSDKYYKALFYVFALLACVEFLFICYINLFRLRDFLGYDASSSILFIQEIVKQKTFFPQNWTYTSQYGFSGANFAAAILGLITNDVFISV
ncbi:MAG: hypothetical protein LBS62_00475, partial [Clostridiales bacterium]|nr:hypothetical protein [Clostridiales bacterium]